MKYFLFVLLTFSYCSVIGQSTDITVKAQKQSLTVSLNDDNSEKVLFINKSKKPIKTDKLVIHNSNSKELKDWNRSFIVFDEADAEVFKVKSLTTNSEISLASLSEKLKKNKDYTLYTIALPNDPARAATVRVRRILVCTISVK